MSALIKLMRAEVQRASRDIRVQYDFDRNGYVITAQDTTGKDDPDGEYTGDEPYAEVAFVPAWSPEREVAP